MLRAAAKKIYQVVPFKRQLLTAVRNTFKVPEKIYKHLSFKGVFKVKVDASHSFKMKHYGYQLENEVFWEGLTGHWEKESMKCWIAISRNANVIFDIGANTGIYSLVAKCINPSATVHAFEPISTVHQKLAGNKELNGYDISCHQMALSDSDGRMAIYKVNSEHTYEATLNKSFEGKVDGEQAVEVEVQTLKTFIEKNNITRIDVMKIDVETHEPEVVKGMAEYLGKFRPVILIELIIDYAVEGVMAHFEGLDYAYFNIDEEKGLRKVDHVGVSDSYNYLFCPKEKVDTLNLL